MRPSSAMRSRILRLSRAVSDTAAWPSATWMGSAGMLALLLLVGSNTRFRAGLLQHLLVLNHFLQQVFELLIADQTAPQVGQAVAQLKQLPERRDLLGDLRGLEIVHA